MIKAKQIFNNISRFVRGSFFKDPLFFWVSLILLSINPLILYFNVSWKDFLFVLTFYYLLSYLLLLITNITGILGRILKPLFISLFFVFATIAFFCKIKFDRMLDANIFSTIFQTNLEELQTFITTFFPWWIIALCFLLLLVLLVIHHIFCTSFIKYRETLFTSIHSYLLLYFVIFAAFCPTQILSSVKCSGCWEIPLNDIGVNLRDYEPEHITTAETRDDHINKIVLIIGESHAKLHSSLYGYSKNTNPKLQALREQGLLNVYSNVQSPAPNTVSSFKYILNTMQKGEDESQWYHYPTIISMMKFIGYYTSWYSNQEEVGLYDCTASCYAHLCNEYFFNKTKEHLDGDIINKHKRSSKKEFIVYHLMGQHIKFSSRYPSTFNYFTSEDYEDREPHQRQTLAEYDNACRYNDAVVSAIMQKYSTDDAAIIYFSDHGLDVYDTYSDYYGHANCDPESLPLGLNIPFVVYTSPVCKKNHPLLVKQIQERTEQPFSTDCVPYFVLDIAGYKYLSPAK